MPTTRRRIHDARPSRSAGAAHAGPVPVRGQTRIWPVLATAAGVGLVVLAVYWPVLSCTAFYLDDKEYLLENELVQRPGWQSARRFVSEVLAPSTVRGYYQPLAMVSLMLDYSPPGAGGADPESLRQRDAAWVRPFHRTSLLLHVLNAACLVLLLALLLERVWPAAAAGLLWGLHPLTVEPVPWIAERKTLLATFFVLWALILYVKYARQGQRGKTRVQIGRPPGADATAGCHAQGRRGDRGYAARWLIYAAVPLFYVLALLSKPSALPLPLLLLVLDYWPLRRLGRRALLEKLPLFAMGGVAAGLAFVSQAQTGVVGLPWHQEAGRAVLVVCHNVVFYIEKVLWPVGLFPLYLAQEPLDLRQPAVLAGVLGTVALAAAVVVSLRWTRAVAASLGLFFVAVFPTLGVVAVHGAIAADRHMYLPLVAFALLVGWGLSKPHALAAETMSWSLAVLVIAVVAACAAEALATRSYLAYWGDSETLHRRVTTLAPQAVQPRWELGDLLRRAGRLDDALQEYQAAVEVAPDVAMLRHNYGSALAAQGNATAAIAQYQKALELDGRLILTRNVLALALADQGRFDEALAHLDAALRQEPGLPLTLNHYGVVLEKAGRLNEAIAQYQAAVQARPDFSVARSNLARGHYLRGIQLEQQRQAEAAAAEYRLALQIEPGHSDARARLAALGY